MAMPAGSGENWRSGGRREECEQQTCRARPRQQQLVLAASQAAAAAALQLEHSPASRSTSLARRRPSSQEAVSQPSVSARRAPAATRGLKRRPKGRSRVTRMLPGCRSAWMSCGGGEEGASGVGWRASAQAWARAREHEEPAGEQARAGGGWQRQHRRQRIMGTACTACAAWAQRAQRAQRGPLTLSTIIMCSIVRAPSRASSLLCGAPGPLRLIGRGAARASVMGQGRVWAGATSRLLLKQAPPQARQGVMPTGSCMPEQAIERVASRGS